MKNDKKILFVTASPSSSTNQLPCNRFYETAMQHPSVDVDIILNNKMGLPNIYNKFISEENRGKIVVFMHDDAYCEDLNWFAKISEYSRIYDVFGLAGTKGPIDLNKPSAWHLMSERSSFVGSVAHISDTHHWMTAFGPSPERALLIDGVFIAINVDKVLDFGVKFDERFQFHHYDIDFSLSCNKAKLKIGVVPLWLTHMGLGDSMNSQEWRDSSNVFLQKWISS